jgi:transcriptional regulator GlxA family with amidase domain
MSARIGPFPGRRRCGTDPDTIAVVVFDRISPFHLAVPCAVFGEDRSEIGAPRFRVRVCAAESGRLRTSVGFAIEAEAGLRGLDRAGTVIVPSWRDPLEVPPAALLAALVRAAHRGATVVGLCLGAFVLAEAGLLDGRRATTHWNWAAAFAARFPRVALDPRVLYVDEGPIVTSAGTAAGIDCCLHLLARRCGAEIANRVARRMVVPPHRPGGQAQFIEQPLPAQAENERLAALLEWLPAHLDAIHSLDLLAARAGMSRRTFTRRFRRLTGTTVTDWLIAQRLAYAQRLLESTAMSVEEVAGAAGFGSAVSLRQHFARRLGTAPAAYRRAFAPGALRAEPPLV